MKHLKRKFCCGSVDCRYMYVYAHIYIHMYIYAHINIYSGGPGIISGPPGPSNFYGSHPPLVALYIYIYIYIYMEPKGQYAVSRVQTCWCLCHQNLRNAIYLCQVLCMHVHVMAPRQCPRTAVMQGQNASFRRVNRNIPAKGKNHDRKS